MGKTKIEWTTDSWNPLRARNRETGKVGWHCTHASEGCRNCYAERINQRLGTGLPYKPGHERDIEIFLDEKTMMVPLRWRNPRKVFVCSMSDLFADFVTDEQLDRVFAIMALAPQHEFQVLSKRADRMRAYVSDPGRCNSIAREVRRIGDRRGRSNLARGASGRESETQFRRASVQSSAGGIFAAARLSSDHHDYSWREDDRCGAPGDLGSPQRPNTGRYDDQPSERQETGQSPCELGVSDDVGTTVACRERAERRLGSAEGNSQSQGAGDRGAGGRDAANAGQWRDGEGYSDKVWDEAAGRIGDLPTKDLAPHLTWPLPNVWLGVSAEDQPTWDERTDHLRNTPAEVRWVSVEPMLGPISTHDPVCRETGSSSTCPGCFGGLDWIVCGGESGPDARPLRVHRARDLRDQCQTAAVPFFYKQWGEWVSVSEVEGAGPHFSFPDGSTVRRVGKKRAGRLLDGVEWNEFPPGPRPALAATE